MTDKEEWDAISSLMDELDDLQYAGKWEELDEIFTSVDVEKTPLALLITYLRYTYYAAAKEKRFTKWEGLLQRAKSRYDSENTDYFHGLDMPWQNYK